MKTIKKQNFLLAVLLISLAFFMFPRNVCSAQEKWTVPEEYKSIKNTQKGAKDADGIGKSLWKQHCASCHGNEGLGDGKKAGQLDTPMREIGSKEVQSQTDGEIYYKSIIGRDEMPNFEKKIASKDDRWLLINFMRTLK